LPKPFYYGINEDLKQADQKGPPAKASGPFICLSSRHIGNELVSVVGFPEGNALFLMMPCVLRVCNQDELFFQFLDRKHSESKPYRVYMVAGINKFLRIYYARVKEHLNALELAGV